ncbi:DUF4434 domain-containing protein [Haploplasma axanthum]|nr:DUF4434 domain-containing protein [Haploplasma axanthum]
MNRLKKIGLTILLLIIVLLLTRKENQNKTLITTDFIQPWKILDWNDEDFDNHFLKLESVKIKEVIIQWTIESDGDEFKYRLYPSKYETKDKYDSILEKLLKSAKKNNVGIYIGLNNDLLWWNNYQNNEDYLKFQMEVAKNQVDEIENLYREEYFNTILGYYLPFEIYTNASGFSHNWANMFNILIEHLNLKTFSIPLLFSPFLSDYAGSTNQNIKDTFDILFKESKFRDFDLIIPMDSYGNVLPNDLNNENRAFNYLESIRKSIEENSKIGMAVNIEIFSEVNGEFNC